MSRFLSAPRAVGAPSWDPPLGATPIRQHPGRASAFSKPTTLYMRAHALGKLDSMLTDPLGSRLDRYRGQDLAALRRIIADPKSSEDARATAQLQLDRIDPICGYCQERRTSHGGAVCKVLSRFQRSAGKGLHPNSDQAADIRAKFAKEARDRARDAAAKDAAERQGKLF